MNIKHASVVMLFTVLTLIASSATVHSQTGTMPSQLANIFPDISVFENAFKSGDWKKAKSAADSIDKKFRKLIPKIKQDLYGFTEKEYDAIMSHMRDGVVNKNSYTVQSKFIELHEYLLKIISKYDYKIHPLIEIVNKYVKEAEEANNKGNYGRIVSEMDEIMSLFKLVENNLLRTDAMRDDGKKIKATIGEIRSAGLQREKQAVKEGISSLKAMMSLLEKEIKRVENF